MTYRVYFNRKDAENGLIWSVDEGDQTTEVNVKRVVLRGVWGHTDSGPGDNINSPTVWVKVQGRLEVIDDVAYITV